MLKAHAPYQTDDASGSMPSPPRPEIHGILESIGISIGHTNRLLDSLCARLEPVTAQAPPHPNEKTKDSLGGLCPISNVLLTLHSQITEITNRIENQIDHLQI